MQVSVIMPVYNAAPFLERAIQSALEQPQLAELIAIDDASTDHSARILEAWAQKTDRLIYLPAISKEPQRAAAARNRGLARATAPFIAFLDADDYYLPGRFNRTEAYFKAHPEVEGLIEPVEIFYQENYRGIYDRSKKLRRKDSGTGFTKGSFGDILSLGIQCNGLTLRKNSHKGDLYFKNRFYQMQDLDFFRELLFKKWHIAIAGFSSPPVARYRHHSSNTSSQLNEKWTLSAQLEYHWIQKLSSEPNSRRDRWRLFYRYVIFKYHAPLWSHVKKVILYPILFSWETIRLIKYLR